MRAIEFTQVFSYLAVLLEYIDTTEHLCMYGTTVRTGLSLLYTHRPSLAI